MHLISARRKLFGDRPEAMDRAAPTVERDNGATFPEDSDPGRQPVNGAADGDRLAHRCTTSICAPSPTSLLTTFSNVRSINSALSIVTQLSRLHSAAASSASPARTSGVSGYSLRQGDGPTTSAACGSHNTICAPIAVSLSTNNSRLSNSFS